jgi:hypothetical protein
MLLTLSDRVNGSRACARASSSPLPSSRSSAKMASAVCADCAMPGDTVPSHKKAASAARGDILITRRFYREQNRGVVISESCAQLAHKQRAVARHITTPP